MTSRQRIYNLIYKLQQNNIDVSVDNNAQGTRFVSKNGDFILSERFQQPKNALIWLEGFKIAIEVTLAKPLTNKEM